MGGLLVDDGPMFRMVVGWALESREYIPADLDADAEMAGMCFYNVLVKKALRPELNTMCGSVFVTNPALTRGGPPKYALGGDFTSIREFIPHDKGGAVDAHAWTVDEDDVDALHDARTLEDLGLDVAALVRSSNKRSGAVSRALLERECGIQYVPAPFELQKLMWAFVRGIAPAFFLATVALSARVRGGSAEDAQRTISAICKRFGIVMD